MRTLVFVTSSRLRLRKKSKHAFKNMSEKYVQLKFLILFLDFELFWSSTCLIVCRIVCKRLDKTLVFILNVSFNGFLRS